MATSLLEGVVGLLASDTGVTGLLDSSLADVRGLSALVELITVLFVSFLTSISLVS